MSLPRFSRSQEVVCNRLLARHTSRILWRGLEHPVPPARANLLLSSPLAPPGVPITATTIASILVFAQFEDSRNIPTSIAVVRCGPHRHNGAIEHLLEAFHDQLMRSADEAEVVLVIEALDNIGAEQEACTAGRQAPAVDFIRVGPEEIAHCAFVWDFLFAVQ